MSVAIHHYVRNLPLYNMLTAIWKESCTHESYINTALYAPKVSAPVSSKPSKIHRKRTTPLSEKHRSSS